MRIRKRPSIIPLPSSSSSSSSLSQYADPSSSSSLQHQQLLINGGRGEKGTKNIDHGDLQVQVQPNPKPINNSQVVKEDKEVGLDSSSSFSSPKTLDAQLHNNGRSSAKSNSNGKKRRIPAVPMEGSRCSRVNGRGWRCSQQTLIGYSLCEHHLGKGRIKSVTSVGGGVNNTGRKSKQKHDLNLYDGAEGEGEYGRVAAAQVLASLQQVENVDGEKRERKKIWNVDFGVME